MKFKTYVLFFVLFGLLPDLYICLLWWPRLWWLVCLPTAAALASLVLIGAGIRYTDSLRVFSYLIFLFELPKFVFLLFSWIGPWALCLSAAVTLYFAYLIFYSTRHLKVHRLELEFPDLPEAFDGLRVCQLTDLHLGSFGQEARYIKRIVDTTLEMGPDLILFTGDLVNFDSREADSYLPWLATLKAPMGVYAIRGNHDYLLHGCFTEKEREEDMERLTAMERGLGWRVLLNEHVLLEKDGQRLALAGVENSSAHPYFAKRGGNLKMALDGIPEGVFTILLSHDPSHWRSEVVPGSNVPLTLSGHTHGLKFKLAGMHMSHWRLPESAGIYREPGQVLHVSKGLGSAFAFRLGGFPNIDLITLKKL